MLPGELLAILTAGPTLQNPRRIHQPNAPLQALEPEAIALGFGGGSHRGVHLPHQLLQERPDQGGFAGRSGAKQHNHQIAPLQFCLHAGPFLAQGFPLDGVSNPLEGLVDGGQILLGCFPSVLGRFRSRCWTLSGAVGQACANPGPGQLDQEQGSARKHHKHHGPYQSVGQHRAELPHQLVEQLQHHPQADQTQEGQTANQPKAGAQVQGVRDWLLG